MSRRKHQDEPKAPVIGLITLEFHFPLAQSLKHKRMSIKPIKDRLSRRFNVAVAETGYQDLWQRAILSVVAVSGTRSVLESALEAICRDVEGRYSSELMDCNYELID